MDSDRASSFDAGSLCLQFLATGAEPLAVFARREMGLVEPVIDTFGPVAQRDEATLREAIQRVGRLLAAGRLPAIGDVARLNRFAAGRDIPPQVVAGGRHGWLEPVTHAQVIATIARDGVALVTTAPGDRIRLCAAEDCDRIFLDTSRPGRRRWCSMAACGNRAKVAAFRARR